MSARRFHARRFHARRFHARRLARGSLLGGCLHVVSSLAACGAANPEGPAGSGTARCDAEVDGILSAAELPRDGAGGLYVRNLPGRTVAWDPSPPWDLSDGPDDLGATFRPRLGADAATAFAGASVVLPALVEHPELEVALVADEDSIELLGYRSDAGDALRYTEPIPLLHAEIGRGSAWVAGATFRDARIGGVPQAGVERWAFEVLDIGDATVRGGAVFHDVMALRVDIDRVWALGPDPASSETRLLLIAPCFGELGRAVAVSDDLTVLSELRTARP